MSSIKIIQSLSNCTTVSTVVLIALRLYLYDSKAKLLLSLYKYQVKKQSEFIANRSKKNQRAKKWKSKSWRVNIWSEIYSKNKKNHRTLYARKWCVLYKLFQWLFDESAKIKCTALAQTVGDGQNARTWEQNAKFTKLLLGWNRKHGNLFNKQNSYSHRMEKLQMKSSSTKKSMFHT